MSRYSARDPYVDPETGVLINRLGILNQALLEQSEARLVSVRSQQLWLNPLQGNLDFPFLKNVHRHLFQDVYVWAGEWRTVDISKGDNRFAHHAFLESAGLGIFEKLAQCRYLSGLDAKRFCEGAAFYLGELNALHPFRDGNGRTQREFLQLLARRNSYFLIWKLVKREELLKASIASFQGNLDDLTAILWNIIRRGRL